MAVAGKRSARDLAVLAGVIAAQGNDKQMQGWPLQKEVLAAPELRGHLWQWVVLTRFVDEVPCK